MQQLQEVGGQIFFLQGRTNICNKTWLPIVDAFEKRGPNDEPVFLLLPGEVCWQSNANLSDVHSAYCAIFLCYWCLVWA